MVKSVSLIQCRNRALTPNISHSLLRSAGLQRGLLVMLSDPVRTPDPVEASRHLPAGSIIILRHYDAVNRVKLATSLRKSTRQCRQFLLVGDDFKLAALIGADGMHLSGRGLTAPKHYGALAENRRWIISAACHDAQQLARAAHMGVDLLLVSPIFSTSSHEGAPNLGIHRFSRLTNIARADISLVALGGLNADTAKALKGLNHTGLAAIDGLMMQGKVISK